jgi:cathepsin L
VSVPKKNSPQYIQTPLQKGKSTSVPQLFNTLSIDWRPLIITSVKNQGKCGACWAFAAVANLESAYASLTSNLNDFSEQQLIDCSFSEGNNGCVGGMMINAYNYVIKNPISIEKDYPYIGETQTCQTNLLRLANFTIKSSESIVNDCPGLKNIIKSHPVSVVISADTNFIFYQSGILNVCGNVVNHAVQIVGIVENRTPNATKGYYIGKNSWGTSWGESGFFRLDSQANDGNLCDVCLFVQYPTY